MQAQVFFLSNSLLYDIETTLLVSCHITSQCPLNIPSCSLIDSLLGQLEGVVYDSLLQSHAEQEFSNAIDVGSVVCVLDNRFSGIQAIMQLVTEFVPHQYVLNACASLLLLNLSSVSLVVLNGFIKDLLEVICMLLLLLVVF